MIFKRHNDLRIVTVTLINSVYVRLVASLVAVFTGGYDCMTISGLCNAIVQRHYFRVSLLTNITDVTLLFLTAAVTVHRCK